MHQPLKPRNKLHFLFVLQQWTKVHCHHFITAACGRNYSTGTPMVIKSQGTSNDTVQNGVSESTWNIYTYIIYNKYCTFTRVLSDSSLVSCSSMFWTRPSSLPCCLISMAYGERAYNGWITEIQLHIWTLLETWILAAIRESLKRHISDQTEETAAARSNHMHLSIRAHQQTQWHKSISDSF